MKTVWINKVRKREVKSGYKILSLEIPTMKPLDSDKKVEKAVETPVEAAPVVEEKIDFSNVVIEPLFEDFVDFETFSKSDFRAVKVLECEAVPKSNRCLFLQQLTTSDVFPIP